LKRLDKGEIFFLLFLFFFNQKRSPFSLEGFSFSFRPPLLVRREERLGGRTGRRK